MSWAEVYKINSDITTPIDVAYKQRYGLVPSSAVIKRLLENVSNKTTGDTIAAFTPNSNGTVRVKISYSGGVSDNYHIYVTENDSGVLTINNKNNKTEFLWYDLPVVQGKTYKFTLRYAAGGTAPYVSVAALDICGAMRDLTTIR